MPQNPYREPFTLNTDLHVKVEQEVADLLKAMSEHAKISESEMVNTAMRRYIATHSDYVPKNKKKKA